jgi:hypothetical protein
MSEPLSLTVFTIEADRKPLLAFAAKVQYFLHSAPFEYFNCAHGLLRAKVK